MRRFAHRLALNTGRTVTELMKGEAPYRLRFDAPDKRGLSVVMGLLVLIGALWPGLSVPAAVVALGWAIWRTDVRLVGGKRPLTNDELKEWLAYARVEPFGEKRADLRSAQLCALVANVVSDEKKSYQAKDFMPKFAESETERKQKKQEKAEKMRSKFRQMFGSG